MEPDSHRILPQLRLDDLLTELRGRLETVLATRDRVYALLDAVVMIAGNLDLETSERVFDLMRACHAKRGLTSVIVTHNPDLASRCDRMFEMKARPM